MSILQMLLWEMYPVSGVCRSDQSSGTECNGIGTGLVTVASPNTG